MDDPKICVSIAAKDAVEASEMIRDTELQKPDLIELRIDCLRTAEKLEIVREATRRPLIATNRRKDQGGLSTIPEEKRISKLLEASTKGFDYVDLEVTTINLDSVSKKMRNEGAKLIISHHDLNGTPSKRILKRILDEELGFQPDICKIVGMATSYPDNLVYLSFLKENPSVDLVAFAMGNRGIPSRVLSPLFGAAFTYASVNKTAVTAPGQLTIDSLREIYRLFVI